MVILSFNSEFRIKNNSEFPHNPWCHSFRSGRDCTHSRLNLRMKRLPGVSILLENYNYEFRIPNSELKLEFLDLLKRQAGVLGN